MDIKLVVVRNRRNNLKMDMNVKSSRKRAGHFWIVLRREGVRLIDKVTDPYKTM